MERIEIPVEVYFRAKDGKKFYSETECHRYEYLLDKFINATAKRYMTCEDGEGHTHNFFFACNKDDIIEICELSRYMLGYRPQYISDAPKWNDFERGWLWIAYDFDAYGPTPALGTVDDFIELQNDCVKSYKHSLTMAQQIRNTPGPRN